jgi:hypothetical protein
VIDQNRGGENGGLCCPDAAETSRYRYANKRLERIGLPERRALTNQ